MISAQLTRTMFLYFRTRRKVLYSHRAVTAFMRGLPEPMQMGDEADQTARTSSLLVFQEDHASWEDGFVARFWSHKHPSDIADQMDRALREFDAWAIHDCRGDFLESPSGGPLSRFLGKIRKADDTKPIALSQIFIMGEESDQRFDETVDKIRSSIESGHVCLPVFHFRDGKILFLNSNEPGNITAHRGKNHLRRVKRWAIVDSEGRSFSTKGEDDHIWLDIPPEIIGRDDVRFVGPEDIEFNDEEQDEE